MDPVTHQYGQSPGVRPVRYFRYVPELAVSDEMFSSPHSADREVGGAQTTAAWVSQGGGGAVEDGA